MSCTDALFTCHDPEKRNLLAKIYTRSKQNLVAEPKFKSGGIKRCQKDSYQVLREIYCTWKGK